MTEENIRKMISKATENVYKRDTPDFAFKIYFYPLAGGLFPDSVEWFNFMEQDDLTVKADQVNWLVAEMGVRLSKIVESMAFEEIYLSVIVYGMIVAGGDLDLVYHIDQTGKVSTHVLKDWKSTRT